MQVRLSFLFVGAGVFDDPRTHYKLYKNSRTAIIYTQPYVNNVRHRMRRVAEDVDPYTWFLATIIFASVENCVMAQRFCPTQSASWCNVCVRRKMHRGATFVSDAKCVMVQRLYPTQNASKYNIKP